MQIGITERGDSALDLSWANKLATVDAAVIITKNASVPAFKNALINAHNNGHKIILHATCTGMGHTIFEPNVPDYKTQIDNLRSIIDMGFPVEQTVLRIDPILPLPEYVELAGKVAEYALNKIPDLKRIRISVMDMHYRHLQQRFIQAGVADKLVNRFKSEDYIDPDIMTAIINTFTPFQQKGISIETCAEPILTTNSSFENNGCVSNKDMDILGLPHVITNKLGVQRPGACKCLPKTELLSRRGQCPHRCLYCFWR